MMWNFIMFSVAICLIGFYIPSGYTIQETDPQLLKPQFEAAFQG